MKLPVSLFLGLCATATLAAQIRVPPLPMPRDLPLPGIDRLLQGDSPISTTLKDARVEVPFLDRLDVKFGDLAALRNNRGTFTLTPGHWAMDLQSFCFHAGTRGPQRTDGQGYLSGRIAGPDSAIFVDMLSKYTLLRDVEQHDMQVLIWALLARTKIRQMDPHMQALAVRVLTPAQILALDSGALDVVPPAVRQRLFYSLPADVRGVAEAENRIRDIMYRANSTYAELERIAVLDGPEPSGGRQVPRDRWSVHPGGYFIRYKPSGYSRTTVEIAAPPRYRISRDAKGRIVSIDWGNGRRTETEYDDSLPAYEPSPNLRTVAYAFKRIKLIRPGANGAPQEIVVANNGWTFVMKRPMRVAAVPRFGFRLASVQPGAGWIERAVEWKQRYDHWNEEYRERVDFYRERYDHMRNPPPSVEDTIRDLEDMQHYRDGIEAALTGGELGWLIEHQERMNAALERATLEIASLPVGSDEGEYVPPYDIALPSHSGSQRLGLSGRGF